MDSRLTQDECNVKILDVFKDFRSKFPPALSGYIRSTLTLDHGKGYYFQGCNNYTVIIRSDDIFMVAQYRNYGAARLLVFT